MTLDQILFLLMLPPFCAMWNHLGGQSKLIPDPRIICRVFGIPLSFAAIAFLCGIEPGKCLTLLGISISGMALWAVPANGEEFMSLPDQPDTHGKNGYKWIFWIVCKIMNVTLDQKLTPAQVRNWGTWYGTILGLLLYPQFVTLSIVLTPWALLGGALCLTQGLQYRFSPDVKTAEVKMGTTIGIMYAFTLGCAIYFGVKTHFGL